MANVDYVVIYRLVMKSINKNKYFKKKKILIFCMFEG